MAFKLDENLKEAFLKHRRGEYDQTLDGNEVCILYISSLQLALRDVGQYEKYLHFI
jgi:hypothetical protein